MADRQREAFPSVEIAILEDSGHWPFADGPDGVGRHVEPFLRAKVGVRRAGVRLPARGHRGAVATSADGRSHRGLGAADSLRAPAPWRYV
jgi:hypothetical protein